MKRDNGRGAARNIWIIGHHRERSVMGMVAAMLGMTSDTGVLAKTSSQLSGRSVNKHIPSWRSHGHRPHQGEGERTRRRNQIDAGMLTGDNGLVHNDRVFGNKIYPYPQALPV